MSQSGGPSPAVLDAARAGLDRVGEHPDSGCPRLPPNGSREFHGVPLEHVIVGRGTSELISSIAQSLREVLLHAYENGDPAMAVSPPWSNRPTGAYRRVLDLERAQARSVGSYVLG